MLPNDTGEWFVTFTKSDGSTFTPELPNFGIDISAGDLESRLNEYFNTAESSWMGYVTVTKVYYDETDAVVGDLASAALGKTVFTVKLQKRINGYSFQGITATVTDSTVINFYYPANGDSEATASSAPLGGYFTITCTDPDTSIPYTTSNIGWWTNGNTISQTINKEIPFLADKTFGYDGDRESLDDRWYWENYRKFFISFDDYPGAIDQCTVQSSTDVGYELTGNSPTFTSETLVDAGSNLFFEPIPMEMLYTSETLPQVLVTIDDLPAACANVDCDYEYVTTTSEITGFSVSGTSVTITGTDLPTTDITVEFGGATCGTISGDSTSLSCTLTQDPYGGDHFIELTDTTGGLIPLASSLGTANVACTVSSVSPLTDINRNGGDTLTIVGTGFPSDISLVTIEFEDGTYCTVTSSTSTEIVCDIDGFDTDSLDVSSTMQF